MYLTIFLIAAGIFGGIQLFFFLGSLLHAKIVYPYFFKPRFEKNTEFPNVHLMVPCKGLPDKLEQVLRNYAEQDYPGEYKLTYSVESERDPGYTLVQRLANEYPHARHVVAGLATQCSQKNQNLLAAMEDDHTSDVFVFADADALAGPTWLKGLVHPITQGKNWLSTGLPSCTLSDTTLPHVLQASLTAFQAKVIMSAGATWGGSTAIWRETFDMLNTREHWSKVSVDDISLYKLVQHHNLRNIFKGNFIRLASVPDLDIEIRTQMKTMSAVTRWFVRQVFYIKFYRRPIWHLAVWGNFGNFILSSIAPFFVFSADKEFQLIGMVGISYMLFLGAINMSLLWIRPKDDVKLRHWAKNFVIGDLFANMCLQLTIPMSSFTWAKIHYKVRRDGTVISVTHPDDIRTDEPTSDSAILKKTGSSNK